MNLLSMLKVKFQRRQFLISQEIFYLNKVTRKNLGALPIIMPYESPIELIIDFVDMLLSSSGMEEDLHTNTSTYGV